MRTNYLRIWGLLIAALMSHSVLADFPSFPSFPNLPPPAMVIPAAPAVAAKSYILVDYLSGNPIVYQDVEERVEPASLTKMMTMYVVDQALRANKIKLTDNVHVSETAYRTQGSRMFLEINSDVPLEEIIKGIIIQSGNDASVAIAEHIAGSEASFAEIMNYFAKGLGMNNTHFVNATGLPDPNHYSTAQDMAILAKALIRDFPDTYKLYSQKEFTFKNIKQTNRNRLLWRNEFVDGIKTGFTENAGYCLVASGKSDNMRLISVVMGAKTDNARIDETNKLLNYGFRFFETRKLYPANTSIKQARIWMGVDKEVGLGLPQDLYVTLGKGQYEKLKATINVNKEIKAPMAKGTPLGTIIIELDEKVIAEQPILALNDVKEAGLFSRVYDSFAMTLKTIWDKVTSS